MPVVPNTKVAVSFYTFSGPYPLLYYVPNDKGTLTLASVNAGNSNTLEVGLGGVNKQFRIDLTAAGQTKASAGGKDDYQDRHQKLIAKAGGSGEAYETYQDTDPCAFSYVQANLVEQRSGWYEGVCFVDVFSSKLCPEANPLNAAMLYAAPPYGDNYSGDAEFLAAIQATAVNIIKTVRGYNALAQKQNLPVIQALRNTLYSSGLYNRSKKVDPDKIARAIFAGFQSELQAQDAGLVELQFPVGTGTQDKLFAVVQDDLAGTNLAAAAGAGAGAAAVAPGGGIEILHFPAHKRPTLANGKGDGSESGSESEHEGVDDDGDAIELQNMQAAARARQNAGRAVVEGLSGQPAEQRVAAEEENVETSLEQTGDPPPGFEEGDVMLAGHNYESTSKVLAGGDVAANPSSTNVAAGVQEEVVEVAEQAHAEGDVVGKNGCSAIACKVALGVLGIGAFLSGVLSWIFVFGGGRKVVKSGVAVFDPQDLNWPQSGDPTPGDLDSTVSVPVLVLNGNPVLIDAVELSNPSPAGSGTWTTDPGNDAIFAPMVHTNQSVTVHYVLDATGAPGAQSDSHTLTVTFSPTAVVDITHTPDAKGNVSLDFDIPSQYDNFTGTIQLIDASQPMGKQQTSTLTQPGIGTWTVGPANQVPANHVAFAPASNAIPSATVPYVRLTAWGQASNQANLTIVFPPPTPPPPPPTPKATVTFVKKDATTLGDWLPAYGAEGYAVAGGSASNPSYVTPVLPTQTKVFSGVSASDPHALVTASNTSTRLAEAWIDAAPAALVIDLPFTDTATHQVAIYCDDYDSAAVSQQVEVIDRATGTVLDMRMLAGFGNGDYLVWNISGPVKISITNTTPGNNAILSGIFFGGPTVTAAFVKQDTATQGSWNKVYGADGYAIAADPTSGADQTVKNPSYVTPVISPQPPFVWEKDATDARDPEESGNTALRAAGSWYAPNPSTAGDNVVLIDLPFSDSAVHQVAIYCLDWDSMGREQTVQVLDASGGVLDTRTLQNFQNGIYLIWKVRGHVQIQIAQTAGRNGVVSGIFFDTPSTTMAFATASLAPKAYDFTVWPLDAKATTTIGDRIQIDFVKHCVAPNGLDGPGLRLDDSSFSDVFADSGRWYIDSDGNVGAPNWFIYLQPAYGLATDRAYTMKYSVADQTGARSNTATIRVDFRTAGMLAPKAANFLLPADATDGKMIACDVLVDSSAFFGKDANTVALLGLVDVMQGNRKAKPFIGDKGKVMSVPGEGIWRVDDNGMVLFQATDDLKHAPTAALFQFSDQKGNLSNQAVILIDPALDEVAKVPPALAQLSDKEFWANFRKHVIDDPAANKPPVDFMPAKFITIAHTLAVATRGLGNVGANPISDDDFEAGYKKWNGGTWSDLVDACGAITAQALGSSAPKYAARYWQLILMERMALRLIPPKD